MERFDDQPIRLILHVSHIDQPCPRCLSRQPKAGAVVTDAAGVTQFVCRAHLVELGEVAGLVEPPAFDYFAVYPYGYLY